MNAARPKCNFKVKNTQITKIQPTRINQRRCELFCFTRSFNSLSSQASSLLLKQTPKHIPFNTTEKRLFCSNKEEEVTFENFVPQEKIRENEDIRVMRKRLKYQANQRGMKEMCIILGSFAHEHVTTMNDVELKQFELLVRSPDTDLYNWVMEKEETPSDVDSPVMMKLKSFIQNGGANILTSSTIM